MKQSLHSLLAILALSLVSTLPAAFGQDMAAPPPPPTDAPPPAPSDQAPPPPNRRPPQRGYNLKAMTDQLNLTADQVDKVKAILKTQREQGRAVREDTTLSDDDKRAKNMDLMKSTHDQIRALLTEDQQKQFDAMPMNRPRKKKADAN
jgi:Spy/CpxP family protein refolding chaperone